MDNSFEMWLRGRLVRIDGFIEQADRSVGIFGSSFCPDVIRPVPPFPRMIYENAYDDGNGSEIFGDLFSDLSQGEWEAINDAFWDTHYGKDDTNYLVWEGASDLDAMDPDDYIATLDNGRAWPMADNE